MTNWIQSALRVLRQDRQATDYAWVDRHYTYLLNDAYYSGQIYETTANGGQRENINALLGNAAAADLANLYNPTAAVVDLYLHVFAGAFGDEIKALPLGKAGQPLIAAIEQVWQWSNLTIEKQPLCRLAATHGCVGLRIVARNDLDPARRRVYIKPEHPRVIRDVELDDRGNVEAIQLEYDITTGLAEDAQTITIREEMDKEWIKTWRMTNGQAVAFDLSTMEAGGPNSAYENALGVVPYVLLRHEHIGETWGRNAFYRAMGPINHLNSLMTHIEIQIHKHVNGVLFVAASGAAPTTMDLSGLKVAYVDTRNATPPPFMQWMVADLDLAGAIQQASKQQEYIEDLLPELKATQGRFLSGQSGETISELRKPAEDRIALARSLYEDALVRADQIAVSWGVLMSLWNVGTGMGSREAADAAFRGGFEDHKFNVRPLLGGPGAIGRSATTPPPGTTRPEQEDVNDESTRENPDRAIVVSSNGRQDRA